MFQQKLKVWWYKATDHRHKYTLAGLMVPLILFATLLLVVPDLFKERPQLLAQLLLIAAAGCFAFSGYCVVGQWLFDRKVKKQQGKTKIHDLR